MDQDIKDKWLAALRSGEYVQGSGLLRQTVGDTPKYCCLGVLCQVAGLTINDDGLAAGDEGYANLGKIIDAPEKLSVLWNMNDGTDSINRSYSFEEIADYIEKNL
jgi:hypothetical protein